MVQSPLLATAALSPWQCGGRGAQGKSGSLLTSLPPSWGEGAQVTSRVTGTCKDSTGGRLADWQLVGASPPPPWQNPAIIHSIGSN